MKKIKFIITCTACLCAFVLTPIPVSAGMIYLNDIPLDVNIDCVTIDGDVFVPLRKLADMTGAKLAWDDKTKTVTIYDPFSVESRVLAELTAGEKKAVVYPVDEKGNPLAAVEVEMNAAPAIINSLTYLPLGFIAENLGYDAEYDSATGNIYLKG